MKTNQRGFSALIILLIIVILAGLGFAGYQVYKTGQVKTVENNDDSQPADKSQETVDPTADWKTYTSKAGKFSLKHPAKWSKDVCDPSATDIVLYLGPTKNSSVICNTEHPSQIMVISTPNTPTTSEQSLPSTYGNQTNEEITVDGVKGKRISGKLIETEEGPIIAPAGTLVVRYFFLLPKRSYIAMYAHMPTGDYSEDNLEFFDLMVQKTLKFTN